MPSYRNFSLDGAREDGSFPVYSVYGSDGNQSLLRGSNRTSIWTPEVHSTELTARQGHVPGSQEEEDDDDEDDDRFGCKDRFTSGCCFFRCSRLIEVPEPEIDFASITVCEIHIYVSGLAYLCLMTFLVYAIVRMAVAIWWQKSRCYGMTSFVVMATLTAAATSRTIHSSVEIYGHRWRCSYTIDIFLYNVIYVCVTSSFALHFRETMKLTNANDSLLGNRMQRLLLAEFLVQVLVTLLTIAVHSRTLLGAAALQIVYAITGFTLFPVFLVAYQRVTMTTAPPSEQTGTRFESSLNAALYNDPDKIQRFFDGFRYLRWISVSGTTSGLLIALNVIVCLILQPMTSVWLSWLLETLLRICEMTLCVGLGHVTSEGYWDLECIDTGWLPVATVVGRCNDALTSLCCKCNNDYPERTKRSARQLTRITWSILGHGKCFHGNQKTRDDDDEKFRSGEDNQRSKRSREPNDKICRYINEPLEKGGRCSMLVNDQGFIRFRMDEDPEQEEEEGPSAESSSDDDDLEDADLMEESGDWWNRKPEVGDSIGRRDTVELNASFRFNAIYCSPTTIPPDDSPTPTPTPIPTPFNVRGPATSMNLLTFKLPSSIHLQDSIEQALNARWGAGSSSSSSSKGPLHTKWRKSADRIHADVTLTTSGSRSSVSVGGLRSPEVKSSGSKWFWMSRRSTPGSLDQSSSHHPDGKYTKMFSLKNEFF